MTFDNYIDSLFERAKYDIDNYIEMLYISARIDVENKCELRKDLTELLIENYLKKRGYVLNNILNRPVWVNGFVCVHFNGKRIEIWHDVKNSKSSFVDKSMLTGLPIALNYFERNMKYKP